MTVLLNENFQSSSNVPSTLFASAGGAFIDTNTSPQLFGPNAYRIPGTRVYSTMTDGSSGDMSVTVSIKFSGSFPAPGVTPLLYGGPGMSIGAQTGYGTGNGIHFFIYNNGGTQQLVISPTVNGSTATNWGAPASGAVTWSSGIWYTMTLTRNHNYLVGSVKREDTGEWLSSAQAWQFDYTEVIAYACSDTLSTGASYASCIVGNGLVTHLGQIVVRDQVTNLPAGKLKGATITANYLLAGSQGFLFGNTAVLRASRQSGLLDQIEVAKSVGCNLVRIDHPLFGYWFGRHTLDTVLSFLGQGVAYAAKLGLWVTISNYPKFGPYYPVGGTQWQDLSNQMVSDVASMAAAMSGYKNLFSFDLYNENNLDTTINMYSGMALQGTFATTAAQRTSYIARAAIAIRAVAPNLALSVSHSLVTTNSFQYLLDYIDIHCYTGSPSTPTSLNSANGAYGKIVWLGEMGWHTSDAQTATDITDAWNVVVNGSYPGHPGCRGMVYWSLEPQQPAYPSIFDGADPEVLVSTRGTTFAGITAPTYFFGGAGRRRRSR